MQYNAVFWFICLFVVLIILEFLYPLGFDLPSIKGIGLFCLFVSLLIASWAKYLYYRNHTSYDPDDKPLTLITNNIYAHSRNPIYIA
ncbi:hypothetical protein ACFLR3_02845, partial [Campylobacterota bacterium]